MTTREVKQSVYLCDPEKHKDCKGYSKALGKCVSDVCTCTLNPSFAATDSEGKPIEAGTKAQLFY